MNILDIAIAKQLAGGGGSGTDNYNELSNLPKINGTTLSGDKSSSSLGLQSEIKEGAELASDLVDDSESDNKFVTSAEKLEWSGKQNLIDSSHKLSSDLVNDADKTNKFVTASEKETWNGKQNLIDNSHKLSSDLVDDTNKTNKFVTSTEKNTWNAKQNAIDADHKLSSSLVSFSEAETAALASGINSTKVGQISTNQTNILYTLNRTGKNLLDTPSVTISTRTWNTDSDGYITAADTTGDSRALNYDNCQYYCHLHSGTYKLVVDIKTASSNGSAIAAIYSKTGTVSTNNLQNKTGVQVYEFTISTEDDYGVLTKLYAGSWRMMICEADMYAKDSSYVPYSLPNYDLTRLQAEDRAALAEEIDAGAKNIISGNWYNSSGDPKLTFTANSDGSLTISKSAATSAAVFISAENISMTSAQYVCSLVTANSNIVLQLRDSSGNTTYGLSTSNTPFTIPNTSNKYKPMIRIDASATFSNVTVKPMICTKAAFGVSQKFVPYCKSNNDLTGIITKGTVTKQYWIKATDLNNVTTSGYYKFTGGPANSPCHTSGDYGMLIVSAFDNYITQLCHKYAFYPGLYTRSSSDSGVTWSAWSDVPSGTSHYKADTTTTIGTDWTLTSIVLKAPVDALVPMTAMALWGAKAPRGIRITRTNTSATNNVIATIEVSEDKAQIQASGFGTKLNGVNTYYVWAKAKESGTMPVYLTYSYPIKD